MKYQDGDIQKVGDSQGVLGSGGYGFPDGGYGPDDDGGGGYWGDSCGIREESGRGDDGEGSNQ
ncbi:hypothetical protein KJ616_00800 [Patescibacteria group bacterium]|nr:hypothetical protein [Patescibacteria group bacterium]